MSHIIIFVHLCETFLGVSLIFTFDSICSDLANRQLFNSQLAYFVGASLHLRDGRKPIYCDIPLKRRSQIVVPYVMYMVVDAYNTPE